MIYYLVNNFIQFTFGFSVGFSVCLFSYEFIAREFPNQLSMFKDKTNNLCINLFFNCVYSYSNLQIIILKFKNKLNTYIQSNETILKIKNEIDKFKNYFYNPEDILIHEEEDIIDNCIGYNFYIHNYRVNNVLNKQVIFLDSSIDSNKPSDIKFMLIEFTIADKLYKIDLKTETFNYYLVGNKFTRDFFIYYIEKHINKNEIINKKDKCFLKIIDHNVNRLEIDLTDKNEAILLENTDYKIIHSD